MEKPQGQGEGYAEVEHKERIVEHWVKCGHNEVGACGLVRSLLEQKEVLEPGGVLIARGFCAFHPRVGIPALHQ